MKFLNKVLHEYDLPRVGTPAPPEKTQVADRLAELERRWKIEREQPTKNPQEGTNDDTE